MRNSIHAHSFVRITRTPTLSELGYDFVYPDLGYNVLVTLLVNEIMAKHVIHISEAEAASNFAGLMARVRSGVEVIIERDAHALAVVRLAEPNVRLLSKSLALLKNALRPLLSMGTSRTTSMKSLAAIASR